MFRNRSVIEILVLAFLGTVCFVLVATSAIVVVVEVGDPKRDTDTIVQALLSILSAILGALLGLLAGRSDATGGLGKRPKDKDEGDD
jgi:predicted permease